jgi:hypothetical protein
MTRLIEPSAVMRAAQEGLAAAVQGPVARTILAGLMVPTGTTITVNDEPVQRVPREPIKPVRGKLTPDERAWCAEQRAGHEGSKR